MKNSYKISILGTYNGILVGRYVSELLNAGVKIDSIIIDSKSENIRDLQLHDERTRGQLPPIPLYRFSNEKIPIFSVADHNDTDTSDLVKHREIDILINGGTPRILKSQILNSAKFGVLNSHPGLLPKYRGCSCVEWALFNGDAVGNSLHLMSEGIDEGDLLMTEAIKFPVVASYSSIRISVYLAGIYLMVKACKGIIRGIYTRQSFRPQQAGTYYKPIDQLSMLEVLRRYPELPS